MLYVFCLGLVVKDKTLLVCNEMEENYIPVIFKTIPIHTKLLGYRAKTYFCRTFIIRANTTYQQP